MRISDWSSDVCSSDLPTIRSGNGDRLQPTNHNCGALGRRLFRMHLTGFIVQFLNGLAEASSLFLVAAGLSLIFGVSRIVNFAHGSLYMLGIYIAYSIVQHWGQGPVGFWASLFCAALIEIGRAHV